MSAAHLQWRAEELWLQLRDLLPGLSVEVVERCASTNTALLERARVEVRPEPDNADVLVQRSVESAAFGRRAADVQPCLLVAEHQTGGRGRLGRGWHSAPGASLTFSLGLPLAPADWSGLSLAVGVAVAGALHPALQIKWPNDLWLHERKLAGILIETAQVGGQRLAVIGIGLNLQPIGEVDAGSGFACLQEIDAQPDAPAVLHRAALPLARALRRFEAEGFAAFVADYARRDLLAGHTVRTTQQGVSEGIARGVDASGALQLQTDAGLVAIHSGEVSVRLDVQA
ncbi:biotin--[acetyl-CoA-carboxylase] ligase [Piscinibacter sp.]|uniref:biotin--[acetyl-CoA-carboxylase] ligase n=1 Tax=Piscinibacter sp. TaxID=1903157 RepID=UPI003784B4B7